MWSQTHTWPFLTRAEAAAHRDSLKRCDVAAYGRARRYRVRRHTSKRGTSWPTDRGMIYGVTEFYSVVRGVV